MTLFGGIYWSKEEKKEWKEPLNGSDSNTADEQNQASDNYQDIDENTIELATFDQQSLEDGAIQKQLNPFCRNRIFNSCKNCNDSTSCTLCVKIRSKITWGCCFKSTTFFMIFSIFAINILFLTFLLELYLNYGDDIKKGINFLRYLNTDVKKALISNAETLLKDSKNMTKAIDGMIQISDKLIN